MTLLNLTGLQSSLGAPAPINGLVTLEYVAGSRGFVEVDGERVILPKTISVALVAGTPTDPLELEPTRGLCALKVTVRASNSGSYLQRFFALPDVPSIDIGDLTQVDPQTFLPTDETLTAWQAAIGEVEAIRDDVYAHTLTATVDPDDANVLILSFPDYMLHPDGMSVLIPLEA